MARDNEILCMPLTDHDNIKGVKEALAAGKKYGVNIIPGVEISIDYNPGTFHMCGYFFDTENRELLQKLEYVQEARRNRNPQIIEKLNQNGVDISMEEVKTAAGSDQVGRPNFARVMLEKGYVKNIKEAFTKYLAKGATCYVDKKRLKVDEAVEVIRNAGGVAVLAHPVQLQLENKKAYQKFFRKMKDIGVVGVECYSSHHSDEESELYASIARETGLLITGGSDFHGEAKPNVKLGEFGDKVDMDIKVLLDEIGKLIRK